MDQFSLRLPLNEPAKVGPFVRMAQRQANESRPTRVEKYFQSR